MRNTDTFKSRNASQGSSVTRPRDQNTYKSSAFEGPKANTINRVLLGKHDSGSQALFGTDDEPLQYTQSSRNTLISNSRSMQNLHKSPTVHHVPAKRKVAEEFHGNTVDKYAMSDLKKDGALMAQNVDWRDSGSKPINTPAQIQSQNLDS